MRRRYGEDSLFGDVKIIEAIVDDAMREHEEVLTWIAYLIVVDMIFCAVSRVINNTKLPRLSSSCVNGVLYVNKMRARYFCRIINNNKQL